MEAQLDEWFAEIDRMKAKVEKADAEAKISLQQEFDDMQAKKRAAREKLDQLKESSDDAWEDLKTGFEGAWSSLKTSLQAAKSRF